MKVTNYEISKKLKEIGFKAETEINWVEYQKYDRDKEIITWHDDQRLETWETVNSLCRAYDLETLISALPKSIIYIEESFHFREYSDSYIAFSLSKVGEESLADCAARMLILLYEKGLIKFNMEK